MLEHIVLFEYENECMAKLMRDALVDKGIFKFIETGNRAQVVVKARVDIRQRMLSCETFGIKRKIGIVYRNDKIYYKESVYSMFILNGMEPHKGVRCILQNFNVKSYMDVYNIITFEKELSK